MSSFFRKNVIAVLTLVAACGHEQRQNQQHLISPVSAKDALSTYQVADGFKIEMIAAEPLVTDPVDMEIDEYGRMYVAEMHGYPLDKSGSGKIIMLSDTNGDGNMDKRTVFKDGLVLPCSIMRWKKGLLVTDAPNLLYLEDTDGDGHANITDTVLTGFALTNPQHNANSPVYGMDNWIYIAHQESVSTREYKEEFGDEGSEIVFAHAPGAPKLPKNADGRSIRFRPDRKLLEMTSSNCQFGQTFDKWGHWFGCNNSNQGYQEVIAERYFRRNPDLHVADATQDMSDHLNAAEVFPTTIDPDRQILTDVGVMTSACGLTAYLGDAFPAPYNGNITFVAEPVSNLVHVDVLKDSGASFRASRVLQHKEFLSSTDAWARPVNFYVGPDGALYVLDYYRRVIESPEWMSEEAIKAGNLYDGMDKGRIFKITPVNFKSGGWTKGLQLGDATSDELVKQLGNANHWWRLNAQRLLVDRQDRNAISSLIAMTKDGNDVGRLHALWTLEGMNALQEQQIENALKDPVAGVRENAVKLAELHLKDFPALAGALLPLEADADAKVRFQLLLTLGSVNTPAAIAVRNKLLFKDINDKWVQIAALSAPASQARALLDNVLNNYVESNDAYASLVEKITAMIGGSGKSLQVHDLITIATNAGGSKRGAILKGLAAGLRHKKAPLGKGDQQQLVNTFFETNDAATRASALQLLSVTGISDASLKNSSLQKAAAIMNDERADAVKRAAAIRFLTLGDPVQYGESLKKLIDAKQESVVQSAAVSTYGAISGASVGEFFIGKWAALTPDIRIQAIDIFMEDSARESMLIDALEKNKINPGSVSFPTSVQLMQNKNESLRKRARAIFTKTGQQGKKLNEQYRDALQISGDADRGKQIFVQNCAICHQVRGKTGVAIGPDLGTVHNWTKQDIMVNILDPDLSISSGFDTWQAELNNGEKLVGIIAAETPAAITLRNQGKMDRTVNRQDIKSLTALGTSAMPKDLAKSIDQKQMADLLAFLRKN
jgi:putative membrane-bound dehydrogenase-like protein